MLGNGEVSPVLNHSHGQLLSVQTLWYLLDKKRAFVLNFNLYPFLPTSYFTSLCLVLLPHLLLLSAIVFLLHFCQLYFLPNFYHVCLLSLFLPPHFLSQHPHSSELICFAEFRCVWVQLWHTASCDLVTSNLLLYHDEILPQTEFHHMRRISFMEIIDLNEKDISTVVTPPSPPHSLQKQKFHLLQYKRMPNWAFWGGEEVVQTTDNQDKSSHDVEHKHYAPFNSARELNFFSTVGYFPFVIRATKKQPFPVLLHQHSPSKHPHFQ